MTEKQRQILESVADEAEFISYCECFKLQSDNEARQMAEKYRNGGGLFSDEIINTFYEAYADITSVMYHGDDYYVRACREEILIPAPINMRGLKGITLRIGRRLRIVPCFPPGNNWPVIDMTDARDCHVEDLCISSAHTKYLGCGVLMARSASDKDAHRNVLRNIEIYGAYDRGACVYIVGAELFTLDNVNLRFSGQRGCALYCSSYNRYQVRSPHGAVAGGYNPGQGGAISNCGGLITGCSHLACDDSGDPLNRYVCELGSRTYHVVFDDSLYVTAKTKNACGAVFRIGDSEDQHPVFNGIHNCRLPLTTMHNEAFGVPLLVQDCANTDTPQHVLNPAYKT